MKKWWPLLLLLVSWNSVEEAYEKITLAKQNKEIPQDFCPSYVIEESILEALEKVVDTKEMTLIHDKRGKQVYRTHTQIIKIYEPKYYLEFVNEIWATETLRRLNPKTFCVPIIDACYLFIDGILDYGVLVEKIAPGRHLNKAETEHAFYRFGEALAELHGYTEGKNSLQFLKKMGKSRSIPYSLKQKLFAARQTGFCLSDIHVKNALYDEQTDQLTLLDVNAVGLLMNDKLRPTCPILHDYMVACYCFNLANEQGKEQFIAGYRDAGGQHFSKKLSKHYATFVSDYFVVKSSIHSD